MGLFDFLKKKKKEIKKPADEKGPLLKPLEEAKKEQKTPAKKKEIKPEIIRPKKKVLGKGYQVLHSPHVTEKATGLVEKNQYVFKVWPGTNKNELKQAVEDTYGVEVAGVRIISIPRKKRRVGRHTGWKKGYKKAVVEVKKGQKIEILPR